MPVLLQSALTGVETEIFQVEAGCFQFSDALTMVSSIIFSINHQCFITMSQRESMSKQSLILRTNSTHKGGPNHAHVLHTQKSTYAK